MSATTFICPIQWKLSTQQARMVEALVDAEDCVHKDDIRQIISSRGASKIVDVILYNTRQRLAPFNIEIATIWGKGLRIEPEAKEMLRAGAIELPAQHAEAA